MIKKFEGDLYVTKPVFIEDNKQNKLKAITFIKKDNTWITHPSLEYINAIVENISLFWIKQNANPQLVFANTIWGPTSA